MTVWMHSFERSIQADGADHLWASRDRGGAAGGRIIEEWFWGRGLPLSAVAFLAQGASEFARSRANSLCPGVHRIVYSPPEIGGISVNLSGANFGLKNRSQNTKTRPEERSRRVSGFLDCR